MELVYTRDMMGNLTGGLKTGGRYLGNLDLTLSVDGKKSWGYPVAGRSSI
ncbi:MAG: hypothetical protein ACREUA_09215 [Burkholderiales bacterium]